MAMDKFGDKLDGINFDSNDTDAKNIFFRYDRMLLGDILTEQGKKSRKLCSYLKFKNLYESDEKIRDGLIPAHTFVEKLPLSKKELRKLKKDLDVIIEELAVKTQIKTSFE